MARSAGFRWGAAKVAWWRTPLGKRVAWASAVLALLVGGLLMFQPWLGNARPPAAEGEGGFAADRDAPAAPAPFDARRAMDYLEDLCKIGPRISGSAGMKKQQDLLEKHFKAHGGKVAWQRFTARQRSVARPVEMANLIVSYHHERARRVILCSHYDTRPIADQEPDRRRWREDFLSANDGGSGVALLMELAHHMKDLKTAVGVDFVFFDGEEYIHDPERDKYFFGSEHFGREYARARGERKFAYAGAVLLDMIAGKGARFPVEENSWRKARPLAQQLWGIARELKCDAFRDDFSPTAVLDDHIALNAAGIPAVDVIDFSYPHWHRLSDVPKNCSGGPMGQVAKVLSVWLQRAK
jgi:glutaminyl-peptide cyclotransferase